MKEESITNKNDRGFQPGESNGPIVWQIQFFWRTIKIHGGTPAHLNPI
jgi:hypothetical protein